MKSSHLQIWTCTLLLAAAGVALRPMPLPGQTPRDLDKYPPERLDADLQAELDDILEDGAPDELVDLSVLKDEIMEALSDEGDDAQESDIDEEDLDAEMAEDGTTLSAVVDRALGEVDESFAPRRKSSIVLVSYHEGPSGVRTTRQLAIKQVKKDIEQAVYQVRR